MNCLFCGRDMIVNVMLRSDAKFCTPYHQTEYWKLRRKLERHQKREIEAVGTLIEVMRGGSELSIVAIEALTDIVNVARSALANITWECRECGQRIFAPPTNDQACDFCDTEEWTVIFRDAPTH